MKLRPVPLSLFLAILLFPACAESSSRNKEEMLILGSHLLQLSKPVYSTLRYKSPPDGIGGNELLTLSTKHDPSLLKPFEGYLLKVRKKGKNASVLVCTKDGAVGLLEDTECTPGRIDKHLWKSKPAASCSFTLDLAALCSP